MKKRYLVLAILIIVLVLSFSIGKKSFSYFKKTKIQEQEVVVSTDCFDITLVNVTSGVNLRSAKPISESEGLNVDPYTFEVKNICNSNENLFVQLDMNKISNLNIDHVKVSLDGDLTLNPTYLGSLSNSETISDTIKDDYTSAKVLATTTLAPDDVIRLNLRMWLDEYSSDINDESKILESKVEIISSFKTETIVTTPYIEVETLYVGNEEIQAKYTFKSDSVNVVSYYISEEDNDTHDWIDITNPSSSYELIQNYRENKTYYLYVKDERGKTGKTSVTIDVTDIEKPEITSVDVEAVGVSQINVTLEATDDTAIEGYYFSLDGENYERSDTGYYEFTDLPQEVYLVYAYVLDTTGNKSLVETRSVTLGTPAVRINDDYYYSIQKAASASQDGDTLVVLRDIVENADIPENKKFTLDIAGYTISSTRETTIDFYDGDVVTVTDSTWDDDHPYGTGMFTSEEGKEIGNTAGGAICVNKGASVVLEHLTFDGNIANNGGAVKNSANLNINSCHFLNNEAHFGGAIHSFNDITINSSIIEGNSVINNGGGLYIHGYNDGDVIINVTINNTQIKNNVAVVDDTMANMGAGIFLQNVNLTTDGNTIVENNTAEFGGGIAAVGVCSIENIIVNANETTHGQGGGIMTMGDLELDNVTITNNTAGDDNSTGRGFGGGVWSKAGTNLSIKNSIIELNTSDTGGGIFSNGSLSLNNTTVESNTATSDGGGLYVYQSNADNPITLTLQNNTKIINNKSSSKGGGIYLAPITTFESDETTLIDGNTANNGAGIYLTSPNTTISNVTISNNTSSATGAGIYVGTKEVVLENLKINNNTSATFGGGLVVSNISSTTISNSLIKENSSNTGGGVFTNGSLTLNNTVIDSNISTSDGGGIYIYQYDSSISGTFKLENNTKIINNKSESSGGGIFIAAITTFESDETTLVDGNTAQNGAGVYLYSSDLTINNMTISNNTASQSGGGVYARLTGTTLDNLKILKNSSVTYGGGIIGSNISSTTISNSLIKENSSNTGGGVFTNGSLTLNNTTIDDNTSTTNGGGIYIYQNNASNPITFKLENNTKIINNTAGSTSYGGGIYLATITTFESDETTLIDNNSAKYGAGMRISSSNLTISNMTISNNSASYSGGGVSISGKNTTIDNLKILNNSATNYGAGVIGANTSSIVIKDSLIKENNANSGAGVFTNGPLTLNNTTIDNNTSVADGGGIYAYQNKSEYPITLKFENNTKIVNNNAGSTAYGGGIYIVTLSTFESDGTTLIDNNSAGRGGGMLISSANKTISNLIISNNNASLSGGGIYSVTKNMIFDNIDVNNNTSSDAGGGITIAETGSATIKDSTINENTAVSGGGIFSNGPVEINNTIVSTNISSSDGAGAYVYQTSTSNPITLSIINESNINNNTATENGGGIYLSNISTINTDSSVIVELNSAKQGAGMYFVSCSTQMGEVIVRQNSAEAGGGIFTKLTVLTLNGTTISNNNATISDGGGVYSYDSILTLNGSTTITSNKAMNGSGGGVINVRVDSTNPNFIMTGSTTISSNEANSGGGLSFFGVDATISGAISNNKSKKIESSLSSINGYGGGIMAASSHVVLNNAVISENEADECGGGIHLNLNTNFEMNGGTIYSNSASYGGGINSLQTVTINSGTISSNISTHDGNASAILMSMEFNYSNDLVLNIYGGEITNNVCATNSYYCAAIKVDGYESHRGQLNIKGNAIINNNRDTDNNNGNIFVMEYADVNIVGAIASGASIGIGNALPSSYTTVATYNDDVTLVDYSSYFHADDSNYSIGFDSANRKLVYVAS